VVKPTSSTLAIPPELSKRWPIIALALIFLLAMSLRMVPTRFGTIMDPDAFFMFRMAGDIVENGYHPTWDNLGWQPVGRSLAGEMPVLPFALAYTYGFLKLIGIRITLNSWTILFPAIVGSASVIPMYFIGKDLRDAKTGLMAALIVGTIPEYLLRTMGGVTDKECLAFPLMLVGFALLVKVLREGDRDKSLFLGLGAGLFLGLVGLTWGGFTYILLLFSVLYGLAIILDITRWTEVADSTILGLIVMSVSMLLLAAGIPNWGINNPFVLIHMLAVFGLVGYFVLVRLIVGRGLLSRRLAVVVFVIVALLVVLFPVYGPAVGIIEFTVARKFIILLNPFETPEVGMHVTVQEYAIAGAFFALRRRRLEDLLMVLWAGSGFYAGLSAIRSTMLLTPALCLLAAIGISELMVFLSRERALGALLASKTKQAARDIGNELTFARLGGPLTAAALIMLLVPTIYLGAQQVNGRTPILGQGWYDSLTWLKHETSEDAIVVAWWDYGHWITSVAQRRCLADGATTNSTTIQATAFAYLSPEDVALDIFQRFDVDYVVVPEYDFWLVGAFAQIVGNVTDFPDGYYNLDPQSGQVSWTDLTAKGRNTTIYKLLFAQPDPAAGNFELVHQSPGSGAYRDTTVRIYKVNYS
jgi:dolichyl-diphosphooligosaccharide--protein glycosyltransferase